MERSSTESRDKILVTWKHSWWNHPMESRKIGAWNPSLLLWATPWHCGGYAVTTCSAYILCLSWHFASLTARPNPAGRRTLFVVPRQLLRRRWKRKSCISTNEGAVTTRVKTKMKSLVTNVVLTTYAPGNRRWALMACWRLYITTLRVVCPSSTVMLQGCARQSMGCWSRETSGSSSLTKLFNC